MSVNSELYWFLVGADTATSGSGKSETTGQTIFLLQDAEDGVTISLSVPVAFFQHLQTKRPTSSIHCLPAVFTNSVPKTQQIIS